MTYKELITQKNTELAQDKRVRFIGYNTRYGHRMYGTLDNVPKKQCIEMPVCENLMMGLAMGMSLEGFKPVVCFERMDFMLIAADAIINHLNALPMLSGGQFDFSVIIRAVVGHNEPLDPGIQHLGNYSQLFKDKCRFPIARIWNRETIEALYKLSNKPIMLIEYKKLYNRKI